MAKVKKPKKIRCPKQRYPDVIYVYAAGDGFEATVNIADALWDEDPSKDDICEYHKYATGRVIKTPVVLKYDKPEPVKKPK